MTELHSHEIEVAMALGEPVYCPEHGLLTDPLNSTTNDPDDPTSPFLCRACYQPVQLDEPPPSHTDSRGWVWQLHHYDDDSRWVLHRIGDVTFDDIASVVLYGTKWFLGRAGKILWFDQPYGTAVEAMENAFQFVTQAAYRQFTAAHEEMRAASKALATVFAHADRLEER